MLRTGGAPVKIAQNGVQATLYLYIDIFIQNTNSQTESKQDAKKIFKDQSIHKKSVPFKRHAYQGIILIYLVIYIL